MLWIEFLIVFMFSLTILSLLFGEGASAFACLLIAILLTIVVFNDNSKVLKKMGFDEVRIAFPSNPLGPVRSMSVHVPGTPIGCRVGLKRTEDNKWLIESPETNESVTEATELSQLSSIQNWCKKTTE